MTTRTAYLLDIDNLAGSGQASLEQVRDVMQAFEITCRPGTQDQVFCAATAMAAYYVGTIRPGYRVLVGHGKDGADRRLLTVADADFFIRRFQRVVVGSGDGIFAALVDDLRSRGMKVGVVKGRGAISTNLYHAIGRGFDAAPAPLVTLDFNKPFAA